MYSCSIITIIQILQNLQIVKTIVRKQGDIITTSSGESEFRVEAKIFTNPEFRICNRYCDLRNKPSGGIVSKIVYVLGKDSINDNKAAHFYWDKDNVCPDNNDNIFAIQDITVGRYVKLTTPDILQNINGVYSYNINNTTQTSTIHTMPCKTTISDIKLVVKTSFTQDAALSLITSSNNVLINTNDVSLTKCAQYDYNLCEILENNEQLILTLTNNNMSTGNAMLFYTLSAI